MKYILALLLLAVLAAAPPAQAAPDPLVRTAARESNQWLSRMADRRMAKNDRLTIAWMEVRADACARRPGSVVLCSLSFTVADLGDHSGFCELQGDGMVCDLPDLGDEPVFQGHLRVHRKSSGRLTRRFVRPVLETPLLPGA